MIPIGRRTVDSVSFCLADDSQNDNDSVVAIRHTDLIKNGEPCEQGPYDTRMGTISDKLCKICGMNKRQCIGHFGRIDSPYPVLNPIGINYLLQFLKVICHNCGESFLPPESLIVHKITDRLDVAVKSVTSRLNSSAKNTGVKAMHICNKIHVIVKLVKDKDFHTKFEIEYPGGVSGGVNKDVNGVNGGSVNRDVSGVSGGSTGKEVNGGGGGAIEKTTLYPHQIKAVIMKIGRETAALFGWTQESVRALVINKLIVPPVTIRHPTFRPGATDATCHPYTTRVQMIQKEIAKFPPVIPEIISPDLAKIIYDLNELYYFFIMGNDEEKTTISSTLGKKAGIIRSKTLGFRTARCSNAVIGCNPDLAIDEVSIPLVTACKQCKEEVVHENNYERLLAYVHNGPDHHPGAIRIKYASTGKEISTKNFDGVLNIGDTVSRHLIDGDHVGFIRFPSLFPSNISVMRVRVIRTPCNVFGINPLACPFFNADFDGDKMMVVVLSSASAASEASMLSSIQNWLISPATSSPMTGLSEDSLIGMAELTKAKVKMSKIFAMSLFSNISVLPNFGETVTGYDCVNEILRKTPITYSGAPTYYSSGMAHYVKYDPRDIKVVIEGGIHKSGILDKKSVGKGANGGIFHIIANKYNRTVALEVMDMFQRLGQNYITRVGFTFGPRDLMLTEEADNKINAIRKDALRKAAITTELMRKGNIISPPDITVEKHYENTQIANLFVQDSCMDAIISGIDHDNNSLFKITQHGTKGRVDHVCGMIGLVGQRLVNNSRFNMGYSDYRTTVYTRRHDENPVVRGFVDTSYWKGLDIISFIIDCWYNRLDMIRKSMLVAVSGLQTRNSMYNLNLVFTNSSLWVKTDRFILQLAYGGDFLDPRNIEYCKFPTAFCSDAELREKYLGTASDVSGGSDAGNDVSGGVEDDRTNNKKENEEFSEQIINDRNKYREIFLKIEAFRQKEYITDIKPVAMNVQRIILNVCKTFESNLDPDKVNVNETMQYVKQEIDDFDYIMLHPRFRKDRLKVPFHIKNSMFLLKMQMRTYLNPVSIKKFGITKAIAAVIVGEFVKTYVNALASPGMAVGANAVLAYTEPITQAMLSPSKVAASGGAGIDINTNIKEVLGVKPINKLKNPQIAALVNYDRNKPEEGLAIANAVANFIETVKLQQFLAAYQIFFEEFGKPIHPRFRGEKKLCEDFVANNPMLTVPSNLINWCIRLEIIKQELIMKNVTIETIVRALLLNYNGLYIVYSPENAQSLVIRIYIRSNSDIAKSIDVRSIKLFCEAQLVKTTIKGITGISNCRAVTMSASKIDETGAVVRDKPQHGIAISGMNFPEIARIKEIDKKSIVMDSIWATFRYFGIEAARARLIDELIAIVPGINNRHYQIYADVMLSTGEPTSCMTKSGMSKRNENILTRIGFGTPMKSFEDAAVNNTSAPIKGIAPSFIIGGIPNLGTGYNQVIVNNAFVNEEAKRVESIIDSLI